jgi:protein-S-isoprenylcysteine O-methyltransferase Ste14
MKRLAFAPPFPPLTWPRLARGRGYRFRVQDPRARASSRDVGELAAKILIVTLFSSMAIRLARDTAATGHATGLLLVASEALVVVLTMLRRPAGVVDRTPRARLLTAFSTFGPPLVHPMSAVAIAPESVTVAIAAIGLIIVVCGKLSLGRSFGLAPANRGVVSTGLYRFMRHPIYLGYLVTHVAFVAANPDGWNLLILAAVDLALMFRAVCEERTLAGDGAYRAYMQRVRWRVVPGIF